MAAQRSIVICGGAFAGLALALALRQGLGADIPVIVADPALAVRPSRDPRATAIVAACRRLFEALGVWDQVADSASHPRHGRHQFQTGGCHPSGVPDLCRGSRTRRTLRPHGRKPPSDRCAGRACRGRRRRSPGHGGFHLRFPFRWRHRDARRRQCHRGKPAGRRRWRAIKAARARRHCHPWLGLRSIRHRRHRRP